MRSQEYGIAMLDGEPVYFCQRTRPKVDSKGIAQNLLYEHVVYIDSMLPSVEFKESAHQLTNKVYVYSSKQLVEGTFDVPNEVVITIEQILNP